MCDYVVMTARKALRQLTNVLHFTSRKRELHLKLFQIVPAVPLKIGTISNGIIPPPKKKKGGGMCAFF